MSNEHDTHQEIAVGWPPEYNGPLEVLGDGKIPWAGYPTIYARASGEWVWSCAPAYLRHDAFRDFVALQEAGWFVRVGTRQGRLQVRITETKETE